eukprot:TRINITY_DN7057_c0_g1_i1.p1 TRINITY_DN7057_c0_g1~~TRINITY_DN7057_c0_g1_i1.p1  ORF type:complete len:547 (-),score=145.06 TRINITY_DN7057_c0_g1_i1:24-1664(-)
MAFVFSAPEPTVIPVQGGHEQVPVRRVYCVGRNYWDHGIEMGGNPEREPPFFFSKPTDAVLSPPRARPDEPVNVPYPQFTENFHYECELVIVIGRGGVYIPEERALENVFGYAVGVDFTRRDLQNIAKKQGRPWDTSKGFDFSAPIGHVVPRQGCPDIESATMTFKVNGEVKQQTTLKKMIWSCAEIVAKLSEQFELFPGDVIFTGTPAGVGAVKPGDLCQCEVTGLPSLNVNVTAPLHIKGVSSDDRESKEFQGFTSKDSDRIVAETLKNSSHERFKQVMKIFLNHLHRAVKEIEPTFEEFHLALEFFNKCGQISTEKRQEWILLSDILGVSMLVDSLVNASPLTGAVLPPTESSVQGPFLSAHPLREFNEDIYLSKKDSALPCLYTGRVLSQLDGSPIRDAEIDIWLTDVDAYYSVQTSGQPEHNLVGKFKSTAEGRYQFKAIVPTPYPVPTDGPVGTLLDIWGRKSMRPAHIHFKIVAAGFRPLVTTLFVHGDPFLDQDAVFGVRTSLIKDFTPIDNPAKAADLGMWKSPFSICQFDFTLIPL